MNKKLGLIVIIILILVLPFIIFQNNETNFAYVCFSDTCIMAEVADTFLQHTEGLMFREELPEDKGMFFIFDEEGIYSFWMKNTYIPLDIIWIDENLTIIHIEYATPCANDCIHYRNNVPAKYVIEVNMGFTEEYDIQIGDKISLEI